MAPNSKISGGNAETVDREEATRWCLTCGGYFNSDEKMRAHFTAHFHICGTHKALKDTQAAEAAAKVAAAAAKEEAARRAALKKANKKKKANVVTKKAAAGHP